MLLKKILDFRPKSENPMPGILVWIMGWTVMYLLDGKFALGNLALVLVLVGSLAGLWFAPSVSMIFSAVSVALFNFFLVEPRLSFMAALREDFQLLITMLGVSTVVSYLMSKLRRAVKSEALQALRAEQLRQLSEGFRRDETPLKQAELLLGIVENYAGLSALGLVVKNRLISGVQSDGYYCVGIVDNLLREILFESLNKGDGKLSFPDFAGIADVKPFYVNIHSRSGLAGILVIQAGLNERLKLLGETHLQELCDLLGAELERGEAFKNANLSRERIQSQELRNTLLTSISHDYRTPLATIMSAASAVIEQVGKSSTQQITELSKNILLEANLLHQMTSNTLQLARLDADSVQIRKNWESLDEIFGLVIAKSQRSSPSRSVKVLAPKKLPLIYCDAILLVQLFDNLLENSIKYSADSSIVFFKVELMDKSIIVSVVDAGCGVPDIWKEKIFEVFQRVDSPAHASDSNSGMHLRRGVGVGLAVCRAIARVHHAKIWVQDTEQAGTCVCVAFPLNLQPAVPASAIELN
jgi:two-component system sensor histidine kinase KdpD